MHEQEIKNAIAFASMRVASARRAVRDAQLALDKCAGYHAGLTEAVAWAHDQSSRAIYIKRGEQCIHPDPHYPLGWREGLRLCGLLRAEEEAKEHVPT